MMDVDEVVLIDNPDQLVIPAISTSPVFSAVETRMDLDIDLDTPLSQRLATHVATAMGSNVTETTVAQLGLRLQSTASVSVSSSSNTPTDVRSVVVDDRSTTRNNTNTDSDIEIVDVQPPPQRQRQTASSVALATKSPPPVTHSPGSDQSASAQASTSGQSDDVSDFSIAVMKKKPAQDDDDDDICMICFENYTNAGRHRLVSLKCGHLFGQSCIQKWLKGQGNRCPQCNKRSHLRDIRNLYYRKLVVIDTTEMEKMKEQCEKDKESRNHAEQEVTRCQLEVRVLRHQYRKLESDFTEMKQKYITLQNNALTEPSVQSDRPPVKRPAEGASNFMERIWYCPKKTIPISMKGECRVMAYHDMLNTLVVSMPSAHQMFPGYGVRKISMTDMRTMEYVACHSKPIRGLESNNNLILTASVDKTMRLITLETNSVVQVYECPAGVWSCAWNSDDTNYVYAGLHNGCVYMYDRRQTTSEVQVLAPSNKSTFPVVQINYVPLSPTAVLHCSGLLCGTLNGVTFWKNNLPHYEEHVLDMAGICTGVSFDTHSRLSLFSYRASKHHQTTRHLACRLKVVGETERVTADIVRTFYGGRTSTYMSKNHLFTNDGSTFACASDEETQSMCVWSISSGRLVQRLSSSSPPVLDICTLSPPNNTTDTHYLTALTDKYITLYKPH